MNALASFFIVLIMLGGVLFPVGMFMFMTFGLVFGSGKSAPSRKPARRYVAITERSYDFDVD